MNLQALQIPLNQGQGQARLLSLDKIAEHFNVPLADAASNLGVSLNALKTFCRLNGLDRWPYRKVLAGKVVDIKRNADGEGSSEPADLSQDGGLSYSQQHGHELSKMQDGMMALPKWQQGNKGIQNGKLTSMPTKAAATATATATVALGRGTTALEEFKYGFPSGGLSCVESKWWGSGGAEAGRDVMESDEDDDEDEDDDGKGEKLKMEGGERRSGSDEQENPASSLSRIRRKAVEDGRRALLSLGACGETRSDANKDPTRLALARRIFGRFDADLFSHVNM